MGSKPAEPNSVPERQLGRFGRQRGGLDTNWAADGTMLEGS